MVKEGKKRSVVKALSWRITATFITMLLVFFLTGHLALALSVGIFETILKMAVYYVHERAWDKTDWGRKKE